MDKNLLVAIAAGMSPPDWLNSEAFSVGKGRTPNKYEPHQGKRERARRLKTHSPAWHSAQVMAK